MSDLESESRYSYSSEYRNKRKRDSSRHSSSERELSDNYGKRKRTSRKLAKSHKSKGKKHKKLKKARRSESPKSHVKSVTPDKVTSHRSMAHSGSDWNSNKEQELISLRQLVKNVNPKSSDAFSYNGYQPSDNMSMFSDANREVHVQKETNQEENDNKSIKEMSIDDIIDDGLSKTSKGPPLGKVSLKLVNDWFGQDADSTYVKKLRESYLEPENTELLSAKAMNKEIYKNLHEKIKVKDFFAKAVQSNVMAAATANCQLLDAIIDNDLISVETRKKYVKILADSTKLLGRSAGDISIMRKMIVKCNVNQKYHTLCSVRSYTQNLFGEDLNKSVKDADEMLKLNTTLKVHNAKTQFAGKQNYDQKRKQPFQPQGQVQTKNYQGYQQGGFRQQGPNQPHNRGPQKYQKKGPAPATQTKKD